MDIKLNFVEQGEGFPLVMLHGNGEDYTYFKRQMEPFSQHYRVIVVETRGHGQSPRGEAPFTLEQFSEDLKCFLDEQGIDRCHLLGFSDGGNIAMLFSLKYPQYVEKLVLNGANMWPEGLSEELQQEVCEKWHRYQEQGLDDPYVRREWEMQDLMMTQPHIDPNHLAAFTMPTLVVAGENDVIQESHTRLIAQSIPGSRLEILPGDHFVARRNWEMFNHLVLDFLAED